MRRRIQINDRSGPPASRERILILFAFFLTAMVGIMALSVDLGVSFMERRAVRDSADMPPRWPTPASSPNPPRRAA